MFLYAEIRFKVVCMFYGGTAFYSKRIDLNYNNSFNAGDYAFFFLICSVPVACGSFHFDSIIFPESIIIIKYNCNW